MIAIETKLTGDLTSGLDHLVDEVKTSVLFSGVAAMAKVIYSEVQTNALRHKKSGLLYSAIYRVYSPERSSEFVKTYRVSVNKSKAPHWHFLEYGTSRQPADPYIRPAFDHMRQAISAGQARMSQRLSEVGGKA